MATNTTNTSTMSFVPTGQTPPATTRTSPTMCLTSTATSSSLSFGSTTRTNKTSDNSQKRIDWIVRPATQNDAEAVTDVLYASYSTLLQQDYDETLVTQALPFLSQPRSDLLTCGTWYVVEHPVTNEMVGCGGWTAEPPKMIATDNFVESTTTTGATANTPSLRSRMVPHLRHFACHPQWTRCGVGRAIWDRTWKEIRQHMMGQTTTTTTTTTPLEVFSTITAVPFYKSLGFQPQTTVEIPLDGKSLLFPAVLMVRPPAADSSPPYRNKNQV